ncbi:hypothetical protein Vadar_009332 [Vaccinium darrowii]|uniref:Uncharacterized protein n=1 Tax=Vaccinium darrowii TaxID=229202 RepID=A0ACB7YDR7_9ERIC|nr:hypothetical protein Vadar_009332 [Vaccinium darrowii]
MAAADMEEDECELFKDDGFVYKRKKHPALDPTAAPPPPDPAAEENFQGRMKKRAGLLRAKAAVVALSVRVLGVGWDLVPCLHALEPSILHLLELGFPQKVFPFISIVISCHCFSFSFFLRHFFFSRAKPLLRAGIGGKCRWLPKVQSENWAWWARDNSP